MLCHKSLSYILRSYVGQVKVHFRWHFKKLSDIIWRQITRNYSLTLNVFWWMSEKIRATLKFHFLLCVGEFIHFLDSFYVNHDSSQKTKSVAITHSFGSDWNWGLSHEIGLGLKPKALSDCINQKQRVGSIYERTRTSTPSACTTIQCTYEYAVSMHDESTHVRVRHQQMC